MKSGKITALVLAMFLSILQFGTGSVQVVYAEEDPAEQTEIENEYNEIQEESTAEINEVTIEEEVAEETEDPSSPEQNEEADDGADSEAALAYMPSVTVWSAPSDMSNYVTSIRVENQNVNDYEKVRITAAFDDGAPGEHVFTEGDTIRVNWPSGGDGYLTGYQKTLPLISPEGATYATAVITAAGATITFLAAVNEMYEVSGSIYFEALARNTTDTNDSDTKTITISAGDTAADINITKPAGSQGTGEGTLPFFRKAASNIGGGWQRVEGIDGWVAGLDPSDPTYTDWSLTANENRETITSDLIARDTLGEGMQLDIDYAQAELYSSGGTQVTYTGTFDEIAAAFNGQFADSTLTRDSHGNIVWIIGQQTINGTEWHLHYRCEITDYSLATYSNSADVTYSDSNNSPVSLHDIGYYANVNAGGDIVGLPRGVLQVTKKISGTEQTVSDVSFIVQKYEDGNWKDIGTMTTDSIGIARMSKLKTGTYRIYESEAPNYLESEFQIDGITYSENNPYEFYVDLNDTSTTGISLEVSNKVKTTEITAVKQWKNSDGTQDTDSHPDTYFQLYRKTANQSYAAKVGGIRILTDGNTEISWGELNAYTIYGDAYEYFVKEVNAEGEDSVPEGYQKEENGLTVINTKIPEEKINVEVSKTWNDHEDQDGKRPDRITVYLLADGMKTESKVITEEDNWEWTFENLPKYESGNVINYTVEEEAVTDYTTAITGDSDTGFTITNTHIPETTFISGSKTWDDADDQDGKRPESITVNLLANGDKVDSKTVTADDNWAYSFKDLAKYADGEEIVYTITEDSVEDYSTSYDGYDITNSYTPGKTSITVTKSWNDSDNQDGYRPDSVTVYLYADDVNTGKTVTLSATNNWSDSFTDLDEMRAGLVIAYTVVEDSVDKYTTTITGDTTEGFIITNTHTPETIDITGTKTWDDADDQDGKRPESITVRLYANGTEVESVTVTEEDDWSYSFMDLAKNADGEEIDYTISEDAVTDYSTTYDGYDITNSYTPGKTSITVNKVWNDSNDKDGIRPTSIQVQLYANGDANGDAVTLSADNSWRYTWTDLDVKSNKEDIVYTVKEVTAVAGYTTVVGEVKNGSVTITNTHTPATATPTPTPTSTPTSTTSTPTATTTTSNSNSNSPVRATVVPNTSDSGFGNAPWLLGGSVAVIGLCLAVLFRNKERKA